MPPFFPDPIRFLHLRAEVVAAQARQSASTAQGPGIAGTARAWLRLAARRAAALGFLPLSRYINALEQGIPQGDRS